MVLQRLCMAICLVLTILSGICSAQSMEFELSAGTTSVAAEVDYRKPLSSGYMKIGLSGVFANDDDVEYNMGSLKLLVGNDTLWRNFSAEAGIRMIMGSAEDDDHSGDIAAMAFTLQGRYLFPAHVVPAPIEIIGGISYAPGVLSFMDTEQYSELYLGVGVQIITNASIRLTYHVYDIEMDDGPGDWEVNDRAIRIGIAMRF